jgi:hypothetical protein
MAPRVAAAVFYRSVAYLRARAAQRKKHGILSRESRSHQVGGSRGIADLNLQTFVYFNAPGARTMAVTTC